MIARPRLPACCAPRSRRPLHPGRFLESNYLQPLRLSQDQLARELGISRRRVNELIRGHRGITPDTAIRLAIFFGTDASFWMALQSAWELHLAWKRTGRRRAVPVRAQPLLAGAHQR